MSHKVTRHPNIYMFSKFRSQRFASPKSFLMSNSIEQCFFSRNSSSHHRHHRRHHHHHHQQQHQSPSSFCQHNIPSQFFFFQHLRKKNLQNNKRKTVKRTFQKHTSCRMTTTSNTSIVSSSCIDPNTPQPFPIPFFFSKTWASLQRQVHLESFRSVAAVVDLRIPQMLRHCKSTAPVATDAADDSTPIKRGDFWCLNIYIYIPCFRTKFHCGAVTGSFNLGPP